MGKTFDLPSCGVDPQEQAEASVSVLPVRIDGAEGVAFEDSFQQGVKRESLRSLCRVVNATKLPLEVALRKLEPASQDAGTLVARRAAQQVTRLHHKASRQAYGRCTCLASSQLVELYKYCMCRCIQWRFGTGSHPFQPL